MPRAKKFLDGRLRAQRALSRWSAALRRRQLTRRAGCAEHAGMLSQFAGVRLMTLGDGVERGVRMLEFRTGTGLRFTVLVDRALRHRRLRARGAAIGWHSPAGFRHPGLHEYEGEGGLGLAAVLLRPDRHLRPRPHPVHAQPGRGPLPLRPPQDGRQLDPRPHLDHPGPAHRLWRGLGRRRMHALVRGRRPAVDRVRRGPAPDPPHRGQGRRQRDPAQGPRGQPRLLPHAAHAPATTSMSATRCWPRAAATWRRSQHVVWASHAESYRAQGVGYRTMPRAADAVPRAGLGALAGGGPRTGSCRWRWSTTASTVGAAWASWSRPASREFPCQFQWQNLPGRPVRDGHRALDQPRLRQAVRARSAAS